MKIRLFCIPYAGGFASLFFHWKKMLHSSIEHIPIELSGRGYRYNDKLYDDAEEGVEDILSQIKDQLFDLSVLIGKEESIAKELVEDWQLHMLQRCSISYFEGGHFF